MSGVRSVAGAGRHDGDPHDVAADGRALLVDLGVSEPATFSPALPHEVSIAVIVSSPGSWTVNVYVCSHGPSSTVTSLALESVTVGATLRTVTVCVSVGPESPSESVAPADTVLPQAMT